MNQETYIIAEAGVNHNGSLDMALELVDKAAECKANAVKFQTFKAKALVSKNTPKAEYQKKTDEAENQYEMLNKLELSEDAHFILMERCKKRNIDFLSSPFDYESARFLVETLQLPIIKVASGEIANAPMLYYLAQNNKKLILSTGMSTLSDIEKALAVLSYGYLKGTEPGERNFIEAYFSAQGQDALSKNVTLLHCTTEYPAPYNEINLAVMATLSSAFELPIGYSDHTEGITIPVAAVARGAKVIEKHFTLNRDLPGPDHRSSLEPNEFKEMVESIRKVEAAIGNSKKIPTASELRNQSVVHKSIVAKGNIKAGELFTNENITVKRPGGGIPPLRYWDVLGRKATRDYIEDERID
ncbi:N-acetylneuraminate synthase [Paenibacillus thermotolerans]|uniref:N-acetylneuraminate synthase n=1 Tax=Paenibacillus thermotolerans TaxID=3027807 RepID=UPI00308255BA